MQKLTPCLWFDTQAEKAAQYYVSIFKNSRISAITRYDAASAKVSGRPKGSVLTVEFSLGGQQFVALNGGPIFKFTEAVSFAVNCKTQKEVDEYWAKLSRGGERGQCGWLKDKFGLSWQIVPAALGRLLDDPVPEKSQRVMEALLQMKKIDIQALRRASRGR